MSTTSSRRSIENEHDAYKPKDCVKKFRESLRQQTIKVIGLKKKK